LTKPATRKFDPRANDDDFTFVKFKPEINFPSKKRLKFND